MAIRTDRGRAALSSYRVVEPLDGAALVRVRIHTGRTHQIRVHLAALGHPVAGDKTYGGTRSAPSRRMASRAVLAALTRPALHAARLAFDHPASGERLAFESPLPPELAEAVEQLRL
jgi:23S rRNA pseudouridine1911/1915/1917 synthase